ncbi:MAG: hypothetical protein HYR91_12755, partial [Flavobacteriia bacterium]|nr:hypothetical protein [Flavobacteriia bacterium]
MKTIYIIIALATFFCSECYSANRYWVGGTGNWSDNTNHWSASSGGAANASLPSASDNVYFDANSFSAGGQIVSIDADSYCNSMDWTGATNSPTINFPTGSVDLYVAGSLKFIGAMSLTQASASWIRLTSTTTGNTITTAGIAMPTTRFDGVGGEWTLQDNFTHNSSARSFRVVG